LNVLNIPSFFLFTFPEIVGSQINIAFVVLEFFESFSITESFSIFLKAPIIASLSFVNSTLQASAKYSFFLEIARLINGSMRIERKYNKNHNKGKAFHHFFQLPLVPVRIKIYPTVQIIQINTFVITITFTSSFKI